jgi:hypothetical protein
MSDFSSTKLNSTNRNNPIYFNKIVRNTHIFLTTLDASIILFIKQLNRNYGGENRKAK